MHSRDGLLTRTISLKALAIIILIFIPFLLSGITFSQATTVEETNSEEQHVSSNNPVFIAGEFQYFDLTLTVDEEKICIIAYSGDSIPDPYDRSVENYYRWEYDQGTWKDLSSHDSPYIKTSKCSKENNTYFFHIGIDHKANPGHWTIKVIVDEKEVSSTSSLMMISGFTFFLSAIIGVFEPTVGDKKYLVDLDFICSDRKRIMAESEKNVDILVDEVLSKHNPPSKKEKAVDDILDLSPFNSKLLTQNELVKSTITTYPRGKLKKVQPNELNSLFFNKKGDGIKKTFLTTKPWSYNKLLAIIITIALLSITVAPIITSSDFSPPSSPTISSFTLYPDEIISGETILLNVSASDTVGITSVFADISEFERINLSLVEGINMVNDTVYSGFWQGEWLAQDIEPGVYATMITVMNMDNSSVSEKHVFIILPDGSHNNTTQMDKQSHITTKKDVDIIQNETLNKTTSQDVHNDSLVDNTTSNATDNITHVDQLNSDVATVFIVDKKHEEMMVLPGTRFYVERTINGPHGANVTFAPMFSDALTLESIEVVESMAKNVKKNTGSVCNDNPCVFDVSKAKSKTEREIEQLRQKLPAEIKALNKIAYDDVKLQSPRTVRLWFRAPSWEEIQSGMKPSSGEISYLVFTNDENSSFDFEGSTWWSSNWDYRKLITINSSQIDADLVNFPILANITDTDLRDDAQDNGNDIAFVLYSDNSTKLNHEIESFNGATGELVAWVNITSLSSSVDTKIWIYYGNSTCSSQENIPGVWNSNYVGVWHLCETSGTMIYDSTMYGLNGTANSQITLNQAGKIGRSVDVNPSTGSIDSDVNLPATYSTWTVEGWLQLDSAPGWGDLWADSAGSELYPGQIWDSGTFGCYDSNQLQTTSTFPEDGTTWVYVTSKCDGSDTFVYWNGVQENSNGEQRTISGSWSIGDRTSSGEEMDGRVDEVRVSKIARNASWIKTSYNAMNSPETFLSVGSKGNITDTSVDTISPYTVTYSPYTITSTADSGLDNVTLYYRWSDDNVSWDGNGTNWRAYTNDTNPDESSPWSWSFNFPNGTGYYEFYSIGKKSGLPDETAPSTADAICFFNESLNTPPFIDLISPSPNGTTNIGLQPTCSIWANDSEGDTLTIHWYENTTGGWVLRNTNNSVSANSTVNYIFMEFDYYSTTHWWKVSVNDSMDNTSAVYYFTTETIGTSVDPISPYGVTSSPLNITATGPSDLDNVTLYYRWSDDNKSWAPGNTTIIFESFESSVPPSGWTQEYVVGTVDWGRVNPSSNPSSAKHGTYIAELEDSDVGDDKTMLITPSIDLTKYNSAWLDFQHYMEDWLGDQDELRVYWRNTTGGDSWHLLAEYTSNVNSWTRRVLQPPYMNEINIAFEGNAKYGYGVCIDCVYINGSCNGQGINWTGWNNNSNPDTNYPWSWDFNFPNSTGYYQFYSIGKKYGSYDETAPSSADAICYYNPLGSTPTIALVSPAPNGTTDVSLQPMCQIWANDTNGDTINVYWYENTTGGWVLRNTNSSVSANSIVSYAFAEFNDYSTMYWWKVIVNDSTWNTTAVYYFTTEHIDTSVDAIIPYNVTSSQLNITATAPSTLNNVTLWYRYTSDNSSWWNTNWMYRKLITINSSQVDSDLINFPILLSLGSDNDLATHAQNEGDDIAFVLYSDNSTKLNHEIELFNGATGELVTWINITSLSGSSDTMIWIYYNNSDCSDQQNPTGVWDSNYVGVWHLCETSGTTIYDSTMYGLNGTANSQITLNQAGKIGRSVDVNPSTGSIDSDVNLPATYSTWTVEGWLQLDSAPGWGNLWADSAGSELYPGQIWGSGTFGCYDSNQLQTTSTFPEDGTTWTYVTSKCDGSDTFVYWDGVQENSNGEQRTISGSWSIGDRTSSGEEMDGRVDEVRVSKIARNASWIKTSYNSMNNPSTFLNFSSGQSGGWVKWNNNSNPDKSSPWSWDFNFPNSTGYYEFYSIGNKSGSPIETIPSSADAICYYNHIAPTAPLINSYNLSNSTGSKLNNYSGLLDVNNEYCFTINITDPNGWMNIDYIEIKSWHDNGSESITYNQTQGGNLNMYLQYENTTGTANFNLLWPDDEVQLILGNCTETIINETTRIINISFKPRSQVRWASSNDTWNTAQNTTNDPYSWNFNITVIDASGLKAWKKDEYGVYKFTSILPNQDWVNVIAPPGFWDDSSVVTITYSSNYNFNLTIYFEGNLTNATSGDTISIANNVYVLGDADSNDDITYDVMFAGIDEANAIDIFNDSGIFHSNNISQIVNVQFDVYIPIGTQGGKYTARVATKIIQD